VVRPRVTETTALGAAYLAGLAAGYWKSGEEIDAHWQMERRFHPAMEPARRLALRASWHKAVQRSGGWAQA
jgi:glycerol kinase